MEGRSGLAKGVGLDSHGQLDDGGLVPHRNESRGERKRGGWKGRVEEERTGRGPRGKRCAEKGRGLRGGRATGAPGSARGAEGRAGCREVTEARGGGVGGPGLRPGGSAAGRLPRAESEFRLSAAGPGALPGWGGASVHFLTRLRAVLKGPLARPARGRQERAGSPTWSAPVCLHLCPQSCPLLLGTLGGQGRIFKFWSLARFLEGCVTLPATLTVFPPGLFRSTRLGQT